VTDGTAASLLAESRVLVADDDPVARALVKAVLEELGHSVLQAPDGEEAWTMFLNERPPLVVLDVEMPRADGLEVCRRIREMEAARDTFVLVVTSRDGDDELRTILDAGADDYLAKPASPEQLRARLTIAARRRAQDEARRTAERELARARWLAGIGETTIALQHEINNPLAALLGHAELMYMDAEQRGERTEALEVVLEQARRIAGIMRRLAALKNPQTVEYVGGARMIDLSRGQRER
jgi:DNA-binding response OmpR family regulator